MGGLLNSIGADLGLSLDPSTLSGQAAGVVDSVMAVTAGPVWSAFSGGTVDPWSKELASVNAATALQKASANKDSGGTEIPFTVAYNQAVTTQTQVLMAAGADPSQAAVLGGLPGLPSLNQVQAGIEWLVVGLVAYFLIQLVLIGKKIA